jgi:hypothetical protein
VWEIPRDGMKSIFVWALTLWGRSERAEAERGEELFLSLEILVEEMNSFFSSRSGCDLLGYHLFGRSQWGVRSGLVLNIDIVQNH